MLKGGWKEVHTLRSDGCGPLYVEGWDPDALLILMNIIHGRTRKIPRSVNLEMLANIAVLVDYYECVEVVEVFSEMWLNQLKEQSPKNGTRHHMIVALIRLAPALLPFLRWKSKETSEEILATRQWLLLMP